MSTVTLTDRQLHALALLVRHYPQLGTRYPCKTGGPDLGPGQADDEHYLTHAEMADLDRRFRAVLDPINPGPSSVTTEGSTDA